MPQLILGVCYFEAIMPYKQKVTAPKSKSFGAAIFCSAAEKTYCYTKAADYSILPLELMSARRSKHSSERRVAPHNSYKAEANKSELHGGRTFVMSSGRVTPLPDKQTVLPEYSFLYKRHPPSGLLLSVRGAITNVQPPASFTFSVTVIARPQSSYSRRRTGENSSGLPVITLIFEARGTSKDSLSF